MAKLRIVKSSPEDGGEGGNGGKAEKKNSVGDVLNTAAQGKVVKLMSGLVVETDMPVNLKTSARVNELALRIERGEIAEDFRFGIDEWLNYSDCNVLTRADLESERKALVLTHEEFKEIGVITIKLPSGNEMDLDPDDFMPDDVLIFYPWDLG